MASAMPSISASAIARWQRRHQKLIEEAPSPAVTPELRAQMGAVAVAAVRSLRYEGAGTLEFLLDKSGAFYFMEMNTRLQVEHPVTEAITGLDLVELQLRVAAGEPLGLAQDGPRHRSAGYARRTPAAISCRNPAGWRCGRCRGTSGSSTRCNRAREIPPFYDSMIAKLIGHGATRDEARRKLIAGLEQTVAFGVTTNQGFLAACLRHSAFAAGEATTAFIGGHRDDLLAKQGVKDDDAGLAGIAALCHPSSRAAVAERANAGSKFPRSPRASIVETAPCDVEVVRERDGFYLADVAGHAHRFEIEALGRDAPAFPQGWRHRIGEIPP